LYRFNHDAQGNVVTDWRTAYDRGTQKKAGHITRGSPFPNTLCQMMVNTSDAKNS
jgi:hypothetical protein